MNSWPNLRDEGTVREGMIALKSRSVLFESLLLVLVTMADIAWTIYVVGSGMAVEANPLMARLLEHGPAVFTFVKLLYLLPLILVCEWLRTFQPRFATTSVRLALWGYVAIYVIGGLGLHLPF